MWREQARGHSLHVLRVNLRVTRSHSESETSPRACGRRVIGEGQGTALPQHACRKPRVCTLKSRKVPLPVPHLHFDKHGEHAQNQDPPHRHPLAARCYDPILQMRRQRLLMNTSAELGFKPRLAAAAPLSTGSRNGERHLNRHHLHPAGWSLGQRGDCGTRPPVPVAALPGPCRVLAGLGH